MERQPLETVEGAHQEIRRLLYEMDRKSKRGKEMIRRLRRRVEILERLLWKLRIELSSSPLALQIDAVLRQGTKEEARDEGEG